MNLFISLIMICGIATTPQKKVLKPQPVKMLLMGSKVLSYGGPLQFDEIGVKFVGEPSLDGNDEVIDGHRFKPSPEYWMMIEKNKKAAAASEHITVKEGRLYHDGHLVDFGGLEVKWMGQALFWQDWVIGPGLTSKSGAPRLEYMEPHELLYYNFKTRKGGALCIGGKGASSEVRILTQ